MYMVFYALFFLCVSMALCQENIFQLKCLRIKQYIAWVLPEFFYKVSNKQTEFEKTHIFNLLLNDINKTHSEFKYK